MDNSLIFNKIRLVLLGGLTLGVVAQIVYVLWQPAPEPGALLPTINYPPQVPLPSWQFLGSQPLAAKNEHQLRGYQYQYRKDNQDLTIQARHYHHVGYGMNYALMSHNILPPATVLPVIKTDPQRGDYSLWEHQGRVYLAACLNARGKSTVTQAQSVRNRYENGWTVASVLGWLALGSDFADSRCLWSLIFLPQTISTTNQTPVLETAWQNWYDWWKPKFERDYPTQWIKDQP